MPSALSISATVVAFTAAPAPNAAPPGYAIAHVDRPTPLYASPNGAVITRLSTRTEFGSPQTLGVVRGRGRWLAVVSTLRPNGHLGWVRARAVRVTRTQVNLVLDLSRRRLVLRDGDRAVRRMAVGVGRASSPTPVGRFAVTDELSGSRYGPYYGCCIVALSAHQPNLPAGWTGGDRIAIHGTDAPATLGQAASAGCLRAADADLQVLMRRVPLGTPVFIHG